MLNRRVLITLYRDEVAPRFDLATEILLVTLSPDGVEEDRKTLVLAHASADELCDLILGREVNAVITGGIEEEYYHYLRWKRIDVLDSVAGPAEAALVRYRAGTLRGGDILFERRRQAHA